MARTAFNLTVDISKVDGLATRLATLGPDEFAQVAISAVNTATLEIYDLVRPRMLKTLNLSPEYIEQRMHLEFATDPGNVRARIIAIGSKPTMTQLSRYDARQLVRSASIPRRAKGDVKHGIAKGMKQAGVSVQVLRGSTKTISNGFLVELKSGNGWGVATRTGKGQKDYKIRYGPSVYQMFKFAAEQVIDEGTAILEGQLVAEATRMIENNLNSTK